LVAINRFTEIEKILNDRLECSAHKLDHIYRVYDLCILIGEHEENVDFEILLPAALLHDIARTEESMDKSGMIDHAILGGEVASSILLELGYEPERVLRIKNCIQSHRYRSAKVPDSIEAKILFDADKLDILGAVGISRAFMIAGQYGQSLFEENNIDTYINENTVRNGRLKDVSKHSPIIEYEVKLKKYRRSYLPPREKLLLSADYDS